MVECPLECGVKIKSFYSHLTNCKKKHLLQSEFRKCEFDYNHIIRKTEYEFHLDNCSTSKLIN